MNWLNFAPYYLAWEVFLIVIGHRRKTILFWISSTLVIAVVVVMFKIKQRREK